MASRPKRQKVQKQHFQAHTMKWTVLEKKMLKEGIEKYGHKDISKIKERVPMKTEDQIAAYIQKQMQIVFNQTDYNIEAPIDSWLTLASEMVTNLDEADFSALLSRVMSVAGNFEKYPPPSETQPNYSAIYKYLAAILKGEHSTDILGPLECSVLLDVLHDLVDVLRNSHTGQQRQVMQWKYQLLTSKVDINDVKATVVRCRKAVENDFSDFMQPETSTGVESENVSESQNSRNEEESDRSTNQNASSARETDSSANEIDSSTGVSRESCQNVSNQSASASGQTSSNETLQSTSGPGPSASNTQSENVSNTQSESVSNTQSENELRATHSDDTPEVTKVTENEKRRKRGVKKPSEPGPKKPRLYSLNPFGIPVHLLKLQNKLNDKT